MQAGHRCNCRVRDRLALTQAVDFPPHYVLWQTEQWGRDMLTVGNLRWPKRRGAPDVTDFVGAFEVRGPEAEP